MEVKTIVPDNKQFIKDITTRFGVLPNFFITASAVHGMAEELWNFAKSAYLDSPLPPVFKERLFVHLSRFIAVRYCIVRHTGFLTGRGRPSGTAGAAPQTVDEVMALICRPIPDTTVLRSATFSRMEARGENIHMPLPGTPEEYDLFDALTVMFVDPRRSEAARNAVRKAVGDTNFGLLSAMLMYVRAAHYWTKMHPEIEYEPDVVQMMEEHNELASCLLDLTDAERIQADEALKNALTELADIKSILNQKETREAFLLKLSDALRPLNAPLEVQMIASRMFGEYLGVNRVAYGIIDGERMIIGGSYVRHVASLEGVIPFPYISFGKLATQAHRPGEIIAVDDVEEDIRITESDREILRAMGVAAFANVMYQKDGQWIATFVMQSNVPREWTRYELGMMRDVGERIVTEGERIRAEVRLRQSEERHSFLLQLSDTLRPLSDPLEIQRTAIRLLGEHRRASCVTFADIFLDENYAEIRSEYHSADSPSMIGRYEASDFSSGMSTLTAGETFIIEDVINSTSIPETERQNLLDLSFRSIIAFPLMRNGKLHAAITVKDMTPHVWTTQDAEFLKETAERTWAAIERARAEASLRESEKQLLELVKQKQDFIGIASHELKTPVTSIKTYAEILLDRLEEVGDESDVTIMKKLDGQLDRLSNLIRDLLDTTRITEGTLPLNVQQICLNQLLTERVEELKYIGVRHNFVFSLGCNNAVNADKERICQVIVNFISNAVKYSPEGSDVIVTTSDVAGGVRLSVRDHGVGIDDAIKDRVFDRFFRGRTESMKAYTGMGLGLYISAGIIHRHGGSIAVDSTAGKGSEFSFVLPYIQNQ
jgi:signal transduction histidine kinase